MIILDYILSIFYGLYFFIVIVIFHPIQIIAHLLFGWKGQQKVIYILNFILLYGLGLVGTRIKFENKTSIPKNVPLIIVCNHQSMYDIMGLYWFMRQYKPRFVAKIELAKGIPSISYNLRKSGAALIDRKKRKQAISEILKLGKTTEDEKTSVVIFPEGTRSRSGLKPFSPGGLIGLIKRMPSAHIVTIAIKGSNKLDAYKVFPLKSFQKVSWTVLNTFSPTEIEITEVINKCYSSIEQANKE